MDVPTGQAGITPVPPGVAPGGLSQANPECAFGVSSGGPSVVVFPGDRRDGDPREVPGTPRGGASPKPPQCHNGRAGRGVPPPQFPNFPILGVLLPLEPLRGGDRNGPCSDSSASVNPEFVCRLWSWKSPWDWGH